VIANRCQVITGRNQVSSNSMLSGKYRKYHYTENSTDTSDRYAYEKTVPIQEIDINTRKQYQYRGSVQYRKQHSF